jgi:hypothetical protein
MAVVQRGDKMEIKKITVHVKTVSVGRIIKIPSQCNSYCWDPYKDKWVSVDSLECFWGEKDKLPFVLEANSETVFFNLFNKIDEVYYIFIRYNRLCGALIISDTLFIKDTTEEVWRAA